ncbi:MAG: hypothetical protein KME18_17825 [Phormidium tanganyikae FI6-MK23]|nr:hypothetical protein [Phormidium tanganyikae FI6-MK23]
MKTTTHKLLAATFVIGSSLSGVQTALAQTAAGTTISNTATATYSDGTTTYNATSNTVTVKVAEVPGINIVAQSPSNSTPIPGTTITVDFDITNVGNDPTQFFIPGKVKLSDGTNFEQVGDLQIISVNGTTVSASVPADGGETGALLGANGSIAVSGVVRVRATILVRPTAIATSTTTVSLGNTITPNAQNVPHDPTTNAGGKDIDVHTVDNADTVAGETPGVITQINEAMATSTAITVNARLQAFATLLKATSSYSNNNTPSVLTDDTLTYSLALRVENPASPPTGLVASDLHPTAINLDGGTGNQNRILVSDAIPAGTELSSTIPTPPDNTWQVVYTLSDVSVAAHKANWVTVRPAGTITRVGFIRSTSVLKGASVTGFSFSVNPLSSFTGGRVANIAQAFGQSQPGATTPGTSTQLVYDESGDQSPNNQLDGGNPDPTTGGAPGTGLGIGDGVADPTKDGIDPGTGTNSADTATTNQGSNNDTDGGEDTVSTIAATPLNGPNNRPDAINTTNNDDFTNRSIQLPADLNPATPLTDAQTPAVTFNNTVQNTSGSPQTIALLPTAPATAVDLPLGTLVTITAGTDIAVYRYDGTKFVFQATGSSNTSATDPVKLMDIPASDNAPGGLDQVNYTMTIDLPGSTVADPIAQVKGFPVPILAFVDQNNNGAPTNTPGNLTINRLYTGYVGLEKDARILEGGSEVVGYTTDQTALSAAARPGRIIEYRIRYRNVSTLAPSNSGSVDLPANNLVITEDGLDAPNNWFTSTKDPVSGTIPGSAIDPNGTIGGTSNGGDIQIYVDTLTSLAPQGSGTFIFRRRIN